MAGAEDIILGDGVFTLYPTTVSTGIEIGLTRGGGEFTLTREIRQIDADGDYGPVLGRMRKTRVEPTLTVRALEILPANAVRFYAGTACSSAIGTFALMGSTAGISVFGTTSTAEGFLRMVTWAGETKAGRDAVVYLYNPVNLEGDNTWELIDKEEVVPEIKFTGTYRSTGRNDEPWRISWVTTSTA